MAKKSKHSSDNNEQQQIRTTRKEALRSRKASDEKKKFLMGVYAVVGLIAFILLVAIVNEFFIAPNRTVVTVADESISLSEWQDRVGYERTQRITYLEDLYEQTDGNVATIQQFAGQYINELADASTLGENILEQMAFETAACQELSTVPSDADITAEIEASFNYGADIENSISKEEFDTQFAELMANLSEYGVSEETYRKVINSRLCQNRLVEQLAENSDIETEAEQANALFIIFNTEEDAKETASNIADSSFMTVWSALDAVAQAAAEAEEPAADAPAPTTLAAELTWRTKADYEAVLGEETTDLIFTMPINEASEIVVDDSNPEASRYYIILVNGREVRDLPENVVLEAQQRLLVEHVNAYLETNKVESNFWRGRIPSQPLLDPKFSVQVQPETVPQQPVQPVETKSTE